MVPGVRQCCGAGLQDCAVTDDGVRCAVEYNCVRWGSHDVPPQAGIGVYERGPDGLLVAARVYDDVESPAWPAWPVRDDQTLSSLPGW